jgi:hypothetical protein
VARPTRARGQGRRGGDGLVTSARWSYGHSFRERSRPRGRDVSACS